MKLYRKIITFFMTFAIVVSLSVPAFAFNIGEVIQGVGTVVSLIDMAHGIYKEYYNADGSAKPGASVGWTNGGTFGGGAGRKDYTDYVNGVQTEHGSTTLKSDGTFSLSDWQCYKQIYYDGQNQVVIDKSSWPISFPRGTCNYAQLVMTPSFNHSPDAFVRLPFSVKSQSSLLISAYCNPTFQQENSAGFINSIVLYDSAGNRVKGTSQGGSYPGTVTDGINKPYPTLLYILPSGFSGYFEIYFSFKSCSAGVHVYEWVFPTISISPIPGSTVVPPVSDTRTGSLSGNFGYTGPDGTMITAENIKIVNETTNTLFNPVTNTTTNFKDWTYDYSTRTYDITLDTGTKQTITYGDENVTIKEGDTIYNIYYVTPDSTTPPPKPPGTCVHDYVPAVTKAPTCLLPGVKTLTCSKCQDAYTENIPATGHSWTVKETVNTTYDAAGVLLKQGYTIFKCSICGEEYKDSSGTGPPGGGGGGESGKPSIWDKLGSLLGSAANGFITVLKTAVIKILDALVAMFDAINTKLASVTTAIFGLFDRIPQLFGGFTGFLSAVFPFFPPEVFDILTLSILILAAATLIKFFLKR